MTNMIGKVVSVHTGARDTLDKKECSMIEVDLDGIVGDRHRGISRQTWEGDKQAVGVTRRNERMWSAVSAEEIAEITLTMNLDEPLSAASLGANLCIEGIPGLSRLPRGSLLKLPSGVELMVEEYNPPCSDMGAKIASMHTCNGGETVADTAFSQAAKFLRVLWASSRLPVLSRREIPLRWKPKSCRNGCANPKADYPKHLQKAPEETGVNPLPLSGQRPPISREKIADNARRRCKNRHKFVPQLDKVFNRPEADCWSKLAT